jgi:hypothetical protein
MAEREINYKVLAIVIFIGSLLAIAVYLLLSYLAGEQRADITLPVVKASNNPALNEIGSTPAGAQPLPTSTSANSSPTDLPSAKTTDVVITSETVVTSEPGLLMHTVVESENLFRISSLYAVPIEGIMITNGITQSKDIFAGQVLIIPATESRVRPTAQIAQAPVAGTPTPTNTPTPLPPTNINGVPIESIVVLPAEVIGNARQIFARGQELGLNAEAFSKVGDSTIENPHFLARFDEGTYDLGEYVYLELVIDQFTGSFGRQGMAVRRGFHSWSITDPMWADKDNCLPNETPIACEIRINRPAVLLIRLGSNDAGVPGSFDFNVRQVVDYALEQGVLPVIGTKADRFEGEDDANNSILRQIASDYNLPLWDFDLVASTIPGRGLYEDDVHLTFFYPHDYTQSQALQTGHGVHNLTALMVLDAFIAALVLISCSSDRSDSVPTTTSPTTKVLSYSELAASRDIQLTLQAEGSATSYAALPVTVAMEVTTAPPTATRVPETPTPVDPTSVNGVPIDSIVNMPDSVIQRSREIFALGQSLGRSQHSFSKLGDSLIANPHFLTGFDTRRYNLGSYDELQPTVEYFEGSFERYGVAIHAGLHSWGIFDPMWADKNWCQPNESIITCEFRLNNPSVLLILIGSNDAGAGDLFEYNIRKLVEYSIENGVIPVLATKADRFEGPDNSNNLAIRVIARDFEVPLWDFDIAADAIEGRGLMEDNVHLTPYDEFDYTQPQAFVTGHGVHNLTALMVLDAIRTQIMENP